MTASAEQYGELTRLSKPTTVMRSAAAERIAGNLAAFCFVLVCTVMLWASGKGYDFSDEAFDLITISNPYDGVSDFGRLLHPLFLLVNGSIPLLRIFGFAALSVCALCFCFALLQFSGLAKAISRSSITAAAGLAACVAWQYTTWKPTPDYNILNLSGLLLFFAGLLSSGRANDNGEQTLPRVIGPSLLCGASLVVIALTKATTAILIVVVGLIWVILLRPRHAVKRICIAATVAAIVLTAAMIAIDGSVAGFIHAKVTAVLLLVPAQGGVPHGIDSSVTVIFTKPAVKIIQGLSFAAILSAIAAAWCWTSTSPCANPVRASISLILAFLLAGMVAWWRIEDLEVGQTFMGFRLWRLPLLFVALALLIRLLWILRFRLQEQQRRAVAAACLLIVAPVAYSFGTDGPLIWHIAGASILWAGAMMLLAGIAPDHTRRGLSAAIAFLCGVTSVGLLIGVMIEPGRIGAAVWQQSAPVSIGMSHSQLKVNPAAADFINFFAREAQAYGFEPYAPVIDLSEGGAGLTFALGGGALGKSPFLVSDGYLANEAERQQAIALYAAAVPRVLSDVPASVLHQAWIITGDPKYLRFMRPALAAVGLNFPDGYQVVARATRRDNGRTQLLWKSR